MFCTSTKLHYSQTYSRYDLIYGSFAPLRNYTTLKHEHRDPKGYAVLHLYEITLLSNLHKAHVEIKIVLHLYEITLLSNRRVGIFGFAFVLHLYEITLLSNEPRILPAVPNVLHLYEITLLSNVLVRP